jgi:hypothetical protein
MRSADRQAFGERACASDGVEITITRHAVARYAERARAGGSPRRLAEELREYVADAIQRSALLPAGDAHLVPVLGRARWFCLIVKVSGPTEKPYAIVVCTVLTKAMAIETFGHVIGLIHALCASRVAAAGMRTSMAAAG